MLDAIRLATPEEIASLDAGAGLSPECTVIAMSHPKGGADLAVLRRVVEVDPYYPAPNSDTRRRALFIWSLENHMRLSGVREYAFSVKDTDDEWKAIVEKWGAVQTYVDRHTRFRKIL